MKEVRITADRICFLSIGVSIPLGELEAVTGVDYPGLDAIQRVTLRATSRRVRWIPLRLLWAGDVVSIRLTGLDGKAFLARLGQTHGTPAGIAGQPAGGRRAGDDA